MLVALWRRWPGSLLRVQPPVYIDRRCSLARTVPLREVLVLIASRHGIQSSVREMFTTSKPRCCQHRGTLVFVYIDSPDQERVGHLMHRSPLFTFTKLRVLAVAA